MQNTLDKLAFSAKPTGTPYKNWNKCQPASGVRAGPCRPCGVMDVIDEEEGGCVAAGSVTVPEMNGDLLSAALIWACAHLIVNFSVFLMKESTPPP